MSSSLEKLVPILEGLNYLVWADAMKSYLWSQGLWHVASGEYIQPALLAQTVTDAALIKEHGEEMLAWSNKDDAAFGTIVELFTLPHLFQSESDWIPSCLIRMLEIWSEFTRNFLGRSYCQSCIPSPKFVQLESEWSPSRFLTMY